MYPTNYQYTKSHEWACVDGKKAKIGITEFAIQELTDLTFLEFDVQVGDELAKGQEFGQVESVKTTGSLYMPVSGKVLAIHTELPDMLEDLMKDPYKAGWMLEVELTNPQEVAGLLNVEDYKKAAKSSHH